MGQWDFFIFLFQTFTLLVYMHEFTFMNDSLVFPIDMREKTHVPESYERLYTFGLLGRWDIFIFLFQTFT